MSDALPTPVEIPPEAEEALTQIRSQIAAVREKVRQVQLERRLLSAEESDLGN